MVEIRKRRGFPQPRGARNRHNISFTPTVRFVLEEQRNVTQAQTNEIAALVDYTKALVDYERAVGLTLKNHNIEIEKTLVAAK